VLGLVAALPNRISLDSDAVLVAGSAAHLQFDPLVGWSYVFLAVAVVIVAAAWPAWRTSRLQVVEALRAE
jgi:ABC-type antimicrobial peptide transport system permease subunit